MTACTRVAPEIRDELMTWRQERDARLRADTGWLTLAGLHWLKAGAQTVGAGPNVDIRLPERSGVPALLGTIEVNGSITFTAAPGASVVINSSAMTQATLASDANATPTEAQVGPVTFHVIERNGRLGLRVKDKQSDVLKHFAGMRYFEIEPDFRKTARLEPHAQPTSLPVPNVLGFDTLEPSAGHVVFEHDGVTHRLVVMGEAEDGELFIVFGDKTNGHETYGAGRFVYAALLSNRTVTLDFNKAYNPPCVFTPYATCPLPPAGNRLPFDVKAGELRYGAH